MKNESSPVVVARDLSTLMRSARRAGPVGSWSGHKRAYERAALADHSSVETPRRVSMHDADAIQRGFPAKARRRDVEAAAIRPLLAHMKGHASARREHVIDGCLVHVER